MKKFLMECMTPTRRVTRKRQKRILIVVWALVAALSIAAVAQAITAKETVKAWVICQPTDWVNARENPSTKGDTCGRLDTGYELELDGVTKNGFAHCVNMALEITEGWVYSGYIVFDEPEWKDGAWYTVDANGRVAARKSICGDRRCWLNPGTEVQVFWMTEEWAVTTRGFIRSEYLRQK